MPIKRIKRKFREKNSIFHFSLHYIEIHVGKSLRDFHLKLLFKGKNIFVIVVGVVFCFFCRHNNLNITQLLTLKYFKPLLIFFTESNDKVSVFDDVTPDLHLHRLFKGKDFKKSFLYIL